MKREKNMFQKAVFEKTKSIVLFSLLVFCLFCVIYIFFATIIQVNLNKLSKQEVVNSEERLIDVEKNILSNKISRLSSDLLYIADTLELCEENKEGYAQLEKQWIPFSNRKAIYDQIRYIDVDGNEIIRVNYNKEGAYCTAENELQNKKNRYYFFDSIVLDKNQIYISKLDLNIENNQIEDPIKPMIRLSTTIFNADGELKGVVVVNYLAEDMLVQMRKIASSSLGYVFLNNIDGYWLYNGEDSNKEWAFMYEDRMDEKFPTSFEEEWNAIKENKTGFINSEFGVFSYASILTSADLIEEDNGQSIIFSEEEWYLISYISPDSKEGELFNENIFIVILNIMKQNGLILVMLALFAIIIVFLVTAYKIEKNRIKYYSEFDTMTGVYNRRAGFEKLDRIYKEATKSSNKISLCFIDINGLKEVNDGLGHNMGDELILSIVRIIKKNMRTTDFVARFGGDEFLIIFNGMDEKEAEIVWARINVEFEKINTMENRKYLISVSHGIEEFKFNASEYIDLIINEADQKMYSEKRVIKKNIKILR